MSKDPTFVNPSEALANLSFMEQRDYLLKENAKLKDQNNVYYNHGNTPIFISHSIKTNPFGRPGSMEEKIIIMPGDGINVSVLNLKRGRPQQTTCEEKK